MEDHYIPVEILTEVLSEEFIFTFCPSSQLGVLKVDQI